MAKHTIQIPSNFIMGAAASAWQTEGWSGKKKARTHSWTNGTKMTAMSGTMDMDPRLQPTFIIAIPKILR